MIVRPVTSHAITMIYFRHLKDQDEEATPGADVRCQAGHRDEAMKP
jgi:hypothetical protein